MNRFLASYLVQTYLIVFIVSVFLRSDFAQAQANTNGPRPTSASTSKSANTRTVASNPAASDTTQLIDKLIKSLEIDKKVEASIESSGFFLKLKPQGKNPQHQAKINAIYAQAEKEFLASKPLLKSQTLEALKSEYAKKFTPGELNYLLTLSQYEVFKKYNALLDSNDYKKAYGTFYSKNREAKNKLKTQIDELEMPAKGKK